MAKESEPQGITKGYKPPLAPVDQQGADIERFVPDEDVEKNSFKPPLGPVDQVPAPKELPDSRS